MRSKDLIRTTENSKIYLDMDGVLADFFHEYAKLAGVPSDKFGRHDYRSIPPMKVNPTLKKMMGTDFFLRLPKFNTADQLIKLVLSYVPYYNICSSPLTNDAKNSAHYKKLWIKKNLNPQPRDIVITSNKAQVAVNPDGSPNILIDDRGTNIVSWRNAGGIGIKYQADEDSLDKIAEGLKTAFGEKEQQVNESELDQMIAQAERELAQKPDNKFAKAIDKGLGKLGQGMSSAARGIDGLTGAVKQGASPGLGGFYQQSQKPNQTAQNKQLSPTGQALVDKMGVSAYQDLTKAVKAGQKVQPTGNDEVDKLLKNAGLMS